MANTIYRVMGKKGRITIPYEFRQQVGFGCNDILSFTRQDDNTVLVKRETVCNDCKSHITEGNIPNNTLMELLDSLSPAQKQTALIRLSVHCAEQLGFLSDGRNQ